jgi:hypothetical protein
MNRKITHKKFLILINQFNKREHGYEVFSDRDNLILWGNSFSRPDNLVKSLKRRIDKYLDMPKEGREFL